MKPTARPNGTLVRTDLSEDEYAEIRKLAIDRRVKVSRLVGDQLRKLVKPRRTA